jgi:hypothetical protein
MFLDCLHRAFDGADTILASVLKKVTFWKRHAGDVCSGDAFAADRTDAVKRFS